MDHITELVDGYEKERYAYNEEENRRHSAFKKDALEHCGYLNHAKADLIYGMAWERGYAHGFSEVFNELIEICSFLDEFQKED